MKKLGPGITIAGILFLIGASLLFFVGVPIIIDDKVTEVSHILFAFTLEETRLFEKTTFFFLL